MKNETDLRIEYHNCTSKYAKCYYWVSHNDCLSYDYVKWLEEEFDSLKVDFRLQYKKDTGNLYKKWNKSDSRFSKFVYYTDDYCEWLENFILKRILKTW